MMINIDDLMNFAQVNKHHDDEVNRRSAVHSSYYAVFHQCQRIASELQIDLNQKVLDPRNNSRTLTTHQKIAHLLVEYGIQNKNTKIKFMGQRLTSLHSKRCAADYELDLENEFSNQQVGRHILECIQLMQLYQPAKAQ